MAFCLEDRGGEKRKFKKEIRIRIVLCSMDDWRWGGGDMRVRGKKKNGRFGKRSNWMKNGLILTSICNILLDKQTIEQWRGKDILVRAARLLIETETYCIWEIWINLLSLLLFFVLLKCSKTSRITLSTSSHRLFGRNICSKICSLVKLRMKFSFNGN